ncbi:acyl-CoA dehydrogenase family protein, partial [Pseudonocardia sp. NPDC049154]|uniref:acyl-CoA dehydrogenase family protein n=1 Tax=Pseudonocardia sp. NPDC049154 TaxID=3155501 RepID=UPI0033DF9A35
MRDQQVDPADRVDDEDRAALRAAVRELWEDRAGSAGVRATIERPAAVDPELWARIGGLGLLGLTVPAAHGGAGATDVELGIAVEELGAALACGPFFSHAVLAAGLLAAGTEDAAVDRWLPAVAAGTLRATAAVAEAG